MRVISITRKGLALQKQAATIPAQLGCAIGLSKTQGKEIKALCEQLLAAVKA